MGKTNSVIFVLVQLVTSKRRGPIQSHLPPREMSKEQLSSKPAFTVKILGNRRLGGGGAISNRFQGLGDNDEDDDAGEHR